MLTFILNDAPYGNERSYNGLRLALQLNKSDEEKVRVFLMGDAVLCGLIGQNTPTGFYNIGRMVKALLKRGASVYA
jgi:uncharacterized protein involved in oxidation of intracellular sulfur